MVDKYKAEQQTLEMIKHDLLENKVGYYITEEESRQMFEGKYDKLFFVDRESGHSITYIRSDLT